MSKIKWCIIGAGGIADRRMIPAVLLSDDSEIVAVMDKNPEVAEKVRAKYNFKKAYSSEKEMLDNEVCDAVYIGTPVFCHYSQAMLCLEKGLHVFMEKPITMNSEDGAKLRDAFKKAKKQLTIGYMMPRHNLHVKLKNFIKNDKLGKINNVRLQFSCWYPEIPGSWRQKKALGGGGAFMDLAVHCLDLAQIVLDDKIVETKAFIARNTFTYEVEDSAVLIFKTEKGTLGHIDVNFNIPDDCASSKFEVYGTKGSAVCEGTLGQEEVGKMKYIYSPQGDYDASQSRVKAKSVTYYGNGGNIYLKQLNYFTSLIKNGKLDYTTCDNAVEIAKMCDEVYNLCKI